MTIGRVKWTDAAIVDKVLEVRIRTSAKDGSMPTASQLRAIGQEPLVAAINKYGGFDHVAHLCNLAPADHDSRFGWGWESVFADKARKRGMDVVERSRVKEPFDVMVNGILVDVKAASGGFISNGWQWTWRIAKEQHTCRFYALFAVQGDEHELFIVPASEVPLTCATMRKGGKYAKWKDRWDQLGEAAEAEADAWHSQFD